jgi:hypothetical protein
MLAMETPTEHHSNNFFTKKQSALVGTAATILGCILGLQSYGILPYRMDDISKRVVSLESDNRNLRDYIITLQTEMRATRDEMVQLRGGMERLRSELRRGAFVVPEQTP